MHKINSLRGLHTINDQYYLDGECNIINIDTNYIKKQTLGKRGYFYVSLAEKGTGRQIKVPVHRLVALVFIENPNNYEIVNHIDGNKLNNAISNLEWCTQSYNIQHAHDKGLSIHHGEIFNVKFIDGSSYSNSLRCIETKFKIPYQTLYCMYVENRGSKKYKIESINKIS